MPSSGEAGTREQIFNSEGEGVRRVLFDLGVAWEDSDERLMLFEGSTLGSGTETGTGFLDNSSYRNAQHQFVSGMEGGK